MTSPAYSITPGTLVEYLHDNQPLLGFVQEEHGRQFRVLNSNKRQVKLTLPRILPWVGPRLSSDLSRSDILEKLQIHQSKRQDLQASIDAASLWEIAAEEVREAPVRWFAELIWSDPTEDHIAALGRTLLEHKALFKFQPPNFKIFDAETVERKLAEQEAQSKKRALLAQGQSFVHALRQRTQANDPAPLPELPEDVETDLKTLLLTGIRDPENREFQATWKILSKGLPEDTYLPLLLAQAWGLLPRHYNYLLDQADYEWGDAWSQAFSDAVESQIHTVRQQARDPESTDLISIDSSSTSDIDDAFTVRETPGGFLLVLALACPVLGWEFGSSLDQKVFQRVSSLYLPEGSSHMLPEKLGTDLFSLHAGQVKPALLFEARLDLEGRLLNMDFRTAWISIRENKAYARVEEELDAGGSPPLNLGLQLAERLREQRIKNGAVIIEQAEPDVCLEPGPDDYAVSIREPAAYDRAQLMVSEFMILANFAASRWAIEKNIPLFYRTQNISLPSDRAGVWTNPVDIYHLIRELSSAKISTDPKPHASLGVPSYASITSPLRRYPDFLNIAQIQAQLETNKTLWSKEELEAKLPYLNVRLQAVTHVQRNRSRYWKLLYFQRHCKSRFWSGIVVGINEKQVTLALPAEQILVSGPKKIFNEKIALGDRYTLKLGKIHPFHDEIKILNAWEES